MPVSIHKHKRLSATLTPTPTPHSTLGAWELTGRLGTGSFAEVFAARPVAAAGQGPSDYAIKRLCDDLVDDRQACEMFHREAACGAALNHSHLLPILACQLTRPAYFLVLPRLEGATVKTALQAGHTFAVPQALWVARQVADGLTALHQHGWLHLDVQAGNVMVDAAGHATLFDYGFSVPIAAAGTGRRNGVPLMTTLAYTAPERLTSSSAASPAADVYSLGVLLFEMLTGHLPFGNTSPGRTVKAHLRHVPPSPRSFAPELPRSVSQLVTRMLSKQPERRPALAAELLPELLRLEADTLFLRPTGVETPPVMSRLGFPPRSLPIDDCQDA